MYPPDPHGVKKWGDMTPPSSYGCAAPGSRHVFLSNVIETVKAYTWVIP